MFRLLKRLKASEWLQALVSLVFIVTQVWLDLKLPDYMSEITRLTQTPGSAMSDIWLAGGKMLLCALGSVFSAVVVGYFAARIAASFSQRLRSQLFSKVDSFSSCLIPMLSVTLMDLFSPIEIAVEDTDPKIRFAITEDADASAFWMHTKNSSPPYRPITSPSLSCNPINSAARASTISPAICPYVSLTFLNPSISIIKTLIG